MANKTIDALVFCPFYICEAKTTITCEGIIGDKTVNQFSCETEKKEHQQCFCVAKHCAGCGVYASIMKNYPVPDRNFLSNVLH